MPEFGFPTQHRHYSMSSLISSLRDRGDDVRVEAVTARYSDVTRELGGHVDELMQIEKSLGDLFGYSEAISLAESRATTIQSALSRITSIAQVLADTTDLLTTNGTDQDFKAVSIQAREDFGSVVSSLNVQFAGRSLFAGDDSNGLAIADASSIQAASVPFLESAGSANAAYASLVAEFTNPGATFDSVIFQGGPGTAPYAEVAPGERVDYNVRADEIALREVLANVIALGAAYDPSNSIPDSQRRQLAELASDGLRSNISQIIGIQGRVGSAEARIANLKARNTANEASLTIAFNKLAGADQLDSTLELTELERQLETAFATTARMSNLSLVNFL